MNYAEKLAAEFSIRAEYAQNIINLLDEGNTIPFIARYRKEMHGTLDDQTIRAISERLEYLRNLEKRKEEVYSLIDGLGKMDDEIAAALEKAEVLTEVEDIYRPYRPKRKTRASVAKEKGLEPLAELIFAQGSEDLSQEAEKYVDAEKGIESGQDAIQGAMDIISENVSDNAEIRKRLKNIIRLNAQLSSKAVDPEKDSVYRQYYDYSEPVAKIADHRLLAINRGEREGFLRVSIDIEDEKCLKIIYRLLVKGEGELSQTVKAACEDAYGRLIFPSVERELRNEMTEKADENSIAVFAMNLRGLLMQPPVKGHTAIGLDPGFRTGCKLAVVDATGRVLDTAVIYPTHGAAQVQKSKTVLKNMIRKHHAEMIAIGNGTASKETEMFTAECISEIDDKVSYMVVSEAGASVYSASKLAAEEMPDLDLTLRSAVSIARRLQDPLAELVKIEPKAIGVGQYQHDMPQKRLSEALDGVVEDCVNAVGADLNTASPALLSRVAGISKTVSGNIVAYREEHGAFTSRAELKKVSKLGPKAFEQCAGFLRVPESANPLDNTGVHPESYPAAEKLLEICGYQTADIKNGSLSELNEKVKSIGMEAAAQQTGVGVPTLSDIIRELSKPGRDPRDELPPPLLRTDVLDIKDLKEGMELKGTVRNVIDFGAFVDIGVHQDGLVHISQISQKRIRHPSDVLNVGDVVKVKVLSVDAEKGRISLTMKGI
ncbi:MAG: RNA-binding transcriptional accessory protein [Clostridia bacterium]|nr:RNA-binding transcriptional accessory protein [Clostridia bacterium]